MPQDTQQLPSEIGPDIEMLEEVKAIPRSSSSMLQTSQNSRKIGTTKADIIESAKPGTSRPNSCMRNRTLTFHIYYHNSVYKINMSESSTLGKRDNILLIICRHGRINN